VLDSALLWARAPKLFLGVAHLYGAIDRKKSPLEPALRSLVTVRVSQLNGCRFCVDLNSATLLRRGVPSHKVEALGSWRERNLFNEHERVALEYAEAITLSDREVDDGLMEQVRRQFSDDGTDRLSEHVEQVQQRAWRPRSGVLSNPRGGIVYGPRPDCRSIGWVMVLGFVP
jgi:AhpD family alkylhydroperoxidase